MVSRERLRAGLQKVPFTVLAIEAGLLLPFTVVLYGLVIAIDFGQIAHLGHFVAFCWGALYELAFVGIGHERGDRLVLQW